MKKIIFSFMMLFAINASSAHLNFIHIQPDSIRSLDSVSAFIGGDLSNTTMSITSVDLDFSENTYTYNIFAESAGISAPILVPFELSEELGQLTAGTYNFIANSHIDGDLVSSLNTSFTVSEVPLPASSLLFMSAMGFIAAMRRKVAK